MAEFAGEGRRILVVEDDRGIRDLLTTLLVRDGYGVDSAKDGEDAIAAIGARKYDAVLLDVMLPRADGYDVIEHVAANGPPIPIVLATAAFNSVKLERINHDVVVSIIKKPFDLSDVREAVFNATHLLR